MQTYVAAEVVLKITKGVENATESEYDLAFILSQFGISISNADARDGLEYARIIRRYDDGLLEVEDLYEYAVGALSIDAIPQARKQEILDRRAEDAQHALNQWANRVGRLAA
jgi:hypothetical protein